MAGHFLRQGILLLLPFYSHYTGQPALAALPVKNWRILLVQSFFFHARMVGWLVGWGLTALLTQNRSYRACRFVGIFYSKL